MASIDKEELASEAVEEVANKEPINPESFREALVSDKGLKLAKEAERLKTSVIALKQILVDFYGIENLTFKRGGNGGVFLNVK